MKSLEKIYIKRDNAYADGDFESVAYYDQIINNAEKAKRLTDKNVKPVVGYEVIDDEINYYVEE